MDLINKLIKIKSINILTDSILNNYSQLINLNKENIYNSFLKLHIHFINIIKKYCDKTLKYKNEINNFKSNYNYIILATNTKLKLKIFKCYLIMYFLEIRLNNLDNYLGLDFEFNTKKVALMQINFEQSNISKIKNSLIVLFDPNQLDNNWKTFFAHKIICSENTYKILHGADSLDIPFVYEELLENNKKLAIKFTKKFIDTKFICEYSYYSKSKELGKCKIYDLLLNEKIINNKKIKQLHKNEIKMGPIYDIIININTLSKFLINYSLYDVLYLIHLIRKYQKIDNYQLINELTCISFLEKRNITNYIPYIEINKINNYMFLYNKNYTRLVDYFKQKIKNYCSTNLLLNTLMKINYFKKTFTMIFKFIIYQKIANKFIVYVNLKNKEEYSNELGTYNISFLNEYPKLKELIIAII